MAILPARHIRSNGRPHTRRVALAATALAAALLLPALGSASAPGRTPARSAAVEPPPEPRLAVPPAPPLRYALPKGAIWVSNEAQLRRALARNRSRDIVLRNGFYGGSSYYSNPGGDRLYAQSLGKAVLGAGIAMGGTWGPGGGLVRGLAFDVDDSSKTLQDSVIHVWGTGAGTRILDVTLEGHGVVGAGIKARQVEGLIIRRVVARHFSSWGVIVDENVQDAQVSRPPVVTDIDAAYVSRAIPKSSNGTSEACVWIGNTAIVRRVRAHDCAWEGLWAGTAAHDALFEDIRVTNIDIGVYVEHFARSSTFRRLQIGPNVRRGLICEWADPDWDSRPACVNNVIEDSSFDTQIVGVYLDEGTTGTTVRNSTFVNQCWAAIGSYKGVDNLYDTSGNNYRGLLPEAVPVSTDHYSTPAGQCPRAPAS
jgi:hypothetical protein